MPAPIVYGAVILAARTSPIWGPLVARFGTRMSSLICNAMGPVSARWIAFNWKGIPLVMARSPHSSRALMIARTDGIKKLPQELMEVIQQVATSSGARMFSSPTMRLKASKLDGATASRIQSLFGNMAKFAEKGLIPTSAADMPPLY